MKGYGGGWEGGAMTYGANDNMGGLLEALGDGQL